MTPEGRAKLRAAALERWPGEIVHDEGRCIIRRLAPYSYIGLRLPSMDTLRGTQAGHISGAHDRLEAAERMERAGLRGKSWGTERATPEAKRRLDGQKKLQRKWLTRAW